MTKQNNKIKLPDCGIFIGTGVYNAVAGHVTIAGRTHTSWISETRSHLEWLEKVVEDNQGNMAQFWGYSGARSPQAYERLHALEDLGLKAPLPDWENRRNLKAEDWEEAGKHDERNGLGYLKVVKAAAEKGIYALFLYADCNSQWSKEFAQAGGDFYLGYDLGEIFTFRLQEEHINGKDRSKLSLRDLADGLIGNVRKEVERRKKNGWGWVHATSANFYIDYEVAGGTDIPLAEDFAFSHLNMASAISRGLYKQFDLPAWGSHLAHEHYSWIPYGNPNKFPLLYSGLLQKYMAGAKILINESGNWYLQTKHCVDSPMFKTPYLEFGDLRKTDPYVTAPYEAEARKKFPLINDDSPVAKRYRQTISDFYDFVKEHGTPRGQPEVTIAIAKGNLDLSGHEYSPNSAIAGMYSTAEENPFWFSGAPERGWNIVKDVFYPRPPVLAPNLNRFLSGTPHGMVDIVSFVEDRVTAEHLSNEYKALLFSGWNTCSEKQYTQLTEYVRAGGTLFISIPHLSTNVHRNYSSFTVDELVRRGDFSELCGVKVKGKGERFYWATASEDHDGALGFKFPREFGIITTCLGEIEIVDAEAQILAIEDETMKPLLLRRKFGKGLVYFLNSWAYPGAMDQDEGPGSTVDSTGLIGAIYDHIAEQNRGHVWITNPPGVTTRETQYVAYSYFPEDGRICLQNIDFNHSHSICLNHFGVCDRITLEPAEFRFIESVRLQST